MFHKGKINFSICQTFCEVFFSCERRIRTSDLLVMSQMSWPLLLSRDIFFIQRTFKISPTNLILFFQIIKYLWDIFFWDSHLICFTKLKQNSHFVKFILWNYHCGDVCPFGHEIINIVYNIQKSTKFK